MSIGDDVPIGYQLNYAPLPAPGGFLEAAYIDNFEALRDAIISSMGLPFHEFVSSLASACPNLGISADEATAAINDSQRDEERENEEFLKSVKYPAIVNFDSEGKFSMN